MRRVLHLINEVSLATLIAALFATIFVFALGYWVFAIDGQLVFTWTTEQRPGFWDSLYFSVVTISSLGYGDIRPMGPARLLVGLEVIVGLAFLGLLVAKISSVKQDYILRRMYSDVVDDKLAKFVLQLEDQRTLYRTTSAMLISGELDRELTTTFRRDTPGHTFFSQFRQLLADVTELMVSEAHNSALFGEVPDSRIEAIYDNLRGVLRRTTLLWERNPDLASELIFCGNSEDIAHICDLAETLAVLGKRNSRNDVIVELCAAICDLSKTVRTDLLPRI